MSAGDSVLTGRVLLERGRLREARDQFWRETADAEQRGDTIALAEAALGLGGIWVHEHRATLERARVSAVQRRALARLDPASPLAGRLTARLTAEQAYLNGDRAAILAELSSARDQTDPLLLADVLSLTHHCLLGPEDAELRLALAEELITVAPQTGRVLDGLMGLAWRTVDLFLAGDRRASGSLGELRARLDTDPCDSLRYLAAALDVTLAIRAGRLEEAERLAIACYRLGLDVGDADAYGWYGAQLLAIRWLQGRGREVLPLFSVLVSSPTVTDKTSGGAVAALAMLAAIPGDRTAWREASTALASLRSGGLRAIPSSSIWSATMLGVCEAAHALGDAGAAAEAYELLAPYADLPIMASLAVACFGSAHRPLGLAAWTSGDLDTAIAHFDAAVAADLAIDDRPWHAMDLAALADALDRRDGPGDRARAAERRRAAIEGARRSGMARRADEWERAQTDGGAPTIECRRDGRMWRIKVGERAVIVPHTVGMGYLTRLFDHAGEEIAAVELAGRPDAVNAERSRVSVHKAIKRTLATISEADPTLGQDLSSSVITGTHCVYLVPEPPPKEVRAPDDVPGRPRRRPRRVPGSRTVLPVMAYAPVDGFQLYYETHGSGRPLVLLHGGLMTIDLNFGPLLGPLAATRQVIAVELQGHGHTADTDRPMTIEALADDVVALLDHLGIAEADVFGFSLGGLVAYAIGLGTPERVGKLIIASADGHRPPGRESAPLDDDRMPTPADFQAMRDAYDAVAPDPTHFDEFAARTETMVHEFPGWTDELRSLQAPTLLIFGDRDFSPLPDVLELYDLLPNPQLAVLPGTTHMGLAQRPDQLLALITPFLDAR